MIEYFPFLNLNHTKLSFLVDQLLLTNNHSNFSLQVLLKHQRRLWICSVCSSWWRNGGVWSISCVFCWCRFCCAKLCDMSKFYILLNGVWILFCFIRILSISFQEFRTCVLLILCYFLNIYWDCSITYRPHNAYSWNKDFLTECHKLVFCPLSLIF